MLIVVIMSKWSDDSACYFGGYWPALALKSITSYPVGNRRSLSGSR